MQIIKYSWQDRKPLFVIKAGNQTTKQMLFDTELNFRLGKKYCIGYFRDGKNYPCRNRNETPDRQCNECKLEDDYFFCIRCTGDECLNPRKRDECKGSQYYVYLAAFDSILKVGISQEFRIMERLIEQGADFGAKIARLPDGKTVRMMEQKIKKEINVVDRVTGKQKHNTLFGNPNVSVTNIFKAVSLLRGNGMSKHLMNTEIYDLREHYNLHNVLAQPSQFDATEGSILQGRVVAAKGNIIVFRKNNDFFSLNAHDIIGAELEQLN